MPQRFSADRIGGLIWLLFGAAVVYGSWTMDRLGAQGVNPLTAPGVVPGLVGLGIMAFALVLVLRRGEARAEAPGEGGAAEPADDWWRLGLSWLLCILFAGVFLGRGLPFWLLAAVFMFVHMMLLESPERKAEMTLARRLTVSSIIAVSVSVAVAFVFQNLFLVRLP